MTAKELRDLGIEVTLDDRSRVLFSGDKTTIATANLWLRTADRVKIIVGEFPAKTFDELFEGVYALEWEDLLPFGAKFPIAKAKAVKSDLHNEPSIQAITKKAVTKKLQEHYHRPENVPIPETGALFSIEVALHKNVATIMVDTTGSLYLNVVIVLIKVGHRSKRKYGCCNYHVDKLASKYDTSVCRSDLWIWDILYRSCFDWDEYRTWI